MQLGELQHQLARFERRQGDILALSVDEPEASLAMIDRLGLDFALALDLVFVPVLSLLTQHGLVLFSVRITSLYNLIHFPRKSPSKLVWGQVLLFRLGFFTLLRSRADLCLASLEIVRATLGCVRPRSLVRPQVRVD